MPYWPVPFCHELPGTLCIGLSWKLAQDIEWMCLTSPKNKFLMYRVQVLFISVCLGEFSVCGGPGAEAGVKGTIQPRLAGHGLSWTHITLAKKFFTNLFLFSFWPQILSNEEFRVVGQVVCLFVCFISLVNSADACLCVGISYTPFSVLFKISSISPTQHLNQSRKNPTVTASYVYGLPCARCWVGTGLERGMRQGLCSGLVPHSLVGQRERERFSQPTLTGCLQDVRHDARFSACSGEENRHSPWH